MYKKVGIILISAILILGGIGSYARERVVLESTKTNYKTIGSSLAMMYEIKAESGEYQAVNDSVWPQDGYIFNERLSGCKNGSSLTWDDENKRVIMQANVSDRCYVYFDVATLSDLCNGLTLSECITTQVYTGTDGDNGLYYHDGVGSYTNSDQEDGDNSYRYSGANPSNYVCFGPGAETEGTRVNDNLYRIVGVFDDDKDGNYQIKLIKSDYVTSDMLGTDGRDYVGFYSTITSYYKGSMDTSTIAAYRWNYDASVSD